MHFTPNFSLVKPFYVNLRYYTEPCNRYPQQDRRIIEDVAGFSVANLTEKLREPTFAAAMVEYGAWLAVMLNRGKYGRYVVLIHDGEIEWWDKVVRIKPERSS